MHGPQGTELGDVVTTMPPKILPSGRPFGINSHELLDARQVAVR